VSGKPCDACGTYNDMHDGRFHALSDRVKKLENVSVKYEPPSVVAMPPGTSFTLTGKTELPALRMVIAPNRFLIATEIEAELLRARELYPDSIRLPDGVATCHARVTYRRMAQAWCERATREGILTHTDVFDEEVSEALDARSLADLRKELIQVGAMTVKWLEHIDERLAAGEVNTAANKQELKGGSNG